MSDTDLIDPLGRRVRLHEQTWVAHILKQHPEMGRYRESVETAVIEPEQIRLSPADADCRFYFRHGPRAGILLLVVADIVKGRVKTSHPERRTLFVR